VRILSVTGTSTAPTTAAEIEAVVREHLEGLYALYGEAQGLRVARKHLGWYARALPGGEGFRQSVVRLEAVAQQRAAVNDFFGRLAA
jgi:tRNA-dihydrouridine synthase B